MRRAGRVVAEVLALVEEELKPGVSTGHLDRARRGAHPQVRRDAVLQGLPGRQPAPAVPGQHLHQHRRRDRPRHPRRADDPRGPGRVHRRRGHRRRLAWRRAPGPSTWASRRPRSRDLIETTRAAMMAGIAAAVPGNHIEDISAAVEDVARAARLRHHPPVRGPRHRHRDARGAAGPELPDRPPGPQAGARPVPGHRADVHAGRLPRPHPRRRLDGRRPSTGRWRPISRHSIAITEQRSARS